jgi:hypothetical protein
MVLELDDDWPSSREQEAEHAPLSDLKKTRTQGELDELDIIAPRDAWTIDVDSILSSPTFASSPIETRPHGRGYVKGSSTVILCVQGNLHLHHDLLWWVQSEKRPNSFTQLTYCDSAMLPDLYALSPTLHALAICRDPSSRIFSSAAPHALPLVQGVGKGYNHFVHLGLSHPLGGDLPLDALVVIDARGKRRLVLPFGWGGGRHVGTPGGRGVQTALMELLRKCIQTLAKE